MLRLIEEMYKELGLIHALQIPADSLKRFLVSRKCLFGKITPHLLRKLL